MRVTCDTTRGDDWINSSNLNGTTAHTPESLDIAKGQAEQDSQQGAVEVPHLCDQKKTCAEKSDLRRREGEGEQGMILSSRLDIKEKKWLLRERQWPQSVIKELSGCSFIMMQQSVYL